MLARLRSSVVTGVLFWLLLVLLIGIIDLSTGPDYGFGFFYLLAVVPAAWLLGRWPGIIVGLASGFAWFFADAVERRTSIPATAWNASSRTFLFITAAVLVDIVRRERVRLRKLDSDRSHFMRVLEHELAGPGADLARGLRALEEKGGATAPQRAAPVRRPLAAAQARRRACARGGPAHPAERQGSAHPDHLVVRGVRRRR
jgi:hypothetical protein